MLDGAVLDKGILKIFIQHSFAITSVKHDNRIETVDKRVWYKNRLSISIR